MTIGLQSVQTERGQSSTFSFSLVLAEIMLHLLPVFLGNVKDVFLTGGRLVSVHKQGGRLSMVAETVGTLIRDVCSSFLSGCCLLVAILEEFPVS